MASAADLSLAALIERIDAERSGDNLSSALRLAVLDRPEGARSAGSQLADFDDGSVRKHRGSRFPRRPQARTGLTQREQAAKDPAGSNGSRRPPRRRRTRIGAAPAPGCIGGRSGSICTAAGSADIGIGSGDLAATERRRHRDGCHRDGGRWLGSGRAIEVAAVGHGLPSLLCALEFGGAARLQHLDLSLQVIGSAAGSAADRGRSAARARRSEPEKCTCTDGCAALSSGAAGADHPVADESERLQVEPALRQVSWSRRRRARRSAP